jgi:sulfur relay (sulfurtransferase) complex TusBCD TusD component (DsrE family)
MGKLLLILFSPPAQSQNTDTIYELAKTAVEMGHKVTIFCDTDATYNLLAKQILPDKITAAGKMADLIKHGVQVLACRESARLRGIDTKKDFIQGVVESSLGGLAELMEQHDRIVAFGSGDK